MAGLTFCLAFAQANENVRVIVGDHAVTIQAEGASLRDVIEEMSLKGDIIVLSEEALDERVTMDMERPSLPEAVRYLLRHKSYLLYERPQDPYARLWIFSDQQHDARYAWSSRPAKQPYSDPGDETTDYPAMAYSNDAGKRQEAMFALAEEDGERYVGYLEQGLSDPDDGVRAAAIEALMGAGGAKSVETLSIVLSDPDAGVRVDAVDAIGEIGGDEAMKYLQEAMADDDHRVREAAAEWLTELAWRDD